MKSGIKAIIDNEFPIEERVAENFYNKKRVLEKEITKLVKESIENTGNKLEGLEYSFKGAKSVIDKIKRERANTDDIFKTDEDILNEFSDLFRYTEICKHDEIINVTKKTISEMKKNGFVLSKVKNYYNKPFKATGYMGMHLNFISPMGEIIELQVHSEESFKAKQEGHILYEKIRSVSTPIEEKEKLKEEVLKIHTSVKKPKGYKSFKDYFINNELKKQIQEERKRNFEVKLKTQEADKYNSKISIFAVYKEGKKIGSGFEAKLSDESALQFYQDEKNADILCVTNKGELTAEKKVAKILDKDFSIQNIQSFVDNWEEKHTQYMQNLEKDERKEERIDVKEVINER